MLRQHFTRYLQHFRRVGSSYEASESLVEFANSSFGFWTCLLGRMWWEAGGTMTTLLRKHPEQNLQRSRFSRYLQYLRNVGPSYILTKPTSGLCELDLGISEGFRRKLEIGWGEAFFWDDHDTVSWTPRTISPHPSAHTPCTTSKANPPTPRSGL